MQLLHQMKPRHSEDTKVGQHTHGKTIADQDAMVTPDEAKVRMRTPQGTISNTMHKSKAGSCA